MRHRSFRLTRRASAAEPAELASGPGTIGVAGAPREVVLGRPTEVLIGLAYLIGAALALAATASFLSFTAWSENEGNPTEALLLLVPALLLAVVAVLLILRLPGQRLSVQDGNVFLRRALRETTVSIASIARLYCHWGLFGERQRIHYIETHDGKTLSFRVQLQGSTQGDLVAILSEIERGSGVRWVGIDSDGSLRAFLAALRTATGAKTSGALARWLVKALFWIRPEICGLASPLYRWAIGLLGVPTAALFGLTFRSNHQPSDWAIGIVGYVALCLAVNVALVLMRSEVRSREAVEAGLGAAREVQRRLLPKTTLQHPRFELAGDYVAAQEVGGDFFDFVRRADGSLVVVSADIAGKGLPAALFMTYVKGALEMALAGPGELLAALVRVNQCVRGAAGGKVFVSMALVNLPEGDDVLTVVRAGHPPPLVIRAKAQAVEWLRPSGVALGLFDNTGFAERIEPSSVRLEPGDALLLYTDGVTEARDAAGGTYGEMGLARACEALAVRGLGAPEMLSAVLADVGRFRNPFTECDDQSLVVLRARTALAGREQTSTPS